MDFNWWNNRNNTTLNPNIAEGMIPDFSALSDLGKTEALTNFENSDLGIQAGRNGQQSGLQGTIFNAPTVNSNGSMTRGGLNLDGIGMLGSTLGSLGMLWNSFQQRKMARDAFKFQKDAYRENMNNQTQAYNTNLEDRTYSRYHQQDQSRAEADKYLEKNRL